MLFLLNIAEFIVSVIGGLSRSCGKLHDFVFVLLLFRSVMLILLFSGHYLVYTNIYTLFLGGEDSI